MSQPYTHRAPRELEDPNFFTQKWKEALDEAGSSEIPREGRAFLVDFKGGNVHLPQAGGRAVSRRLSRTSAHSPDG